METFKQDLWFALRMMRKNFGFTMAAVLCLMLGIGANVVVFGVLNSLILRPLDVPRPESLYSIERASDKIGSESYPNYIDLRDRNHSFDGLAAFTVDQAGLDTGDSATAAWVNSMRS